MEAARETDLLGIGMADALAGAVRHGSDPEAGEALGLRLRQDAGADRRIEAVRIERCMGLCCHLRRHAPRSPVPPTCSMIRASPLLPSSRSTGRKPAFS